MPSRDEDLATIRRFVKKQEQERAELLATLRRFVPPEPVTGQGARAKQQHWHRTKAAEEQRLKADGVPHAEAHAKAVEHANNSRLGDDQ